ncbi:phosphoribulokinase [Gloeobacter morelensis MG652769]|uniref:phosphoribulokinase n=2 Tax=Gloeobacter TaxID=33071 RepID=A0ABY3PM79_9CYAN|nr:phosphoribulokinase [Gloeobacter morelensis MG652769]
METLTATEPQPMTNSVQFVCATARQQLKQLRSPIIVGVAGDSGSGKTTYSNGIRRLLGSDLVSTICTDGYHKEDREQRQLSGRLPLDPAANHLDRLAEHLEALKLGKAVPVPVYNHGSGKFERPENFVPTPIVVVEGLHTLYPELIPYLDFSLYVDPDHPVKWQWKWERDLKRRGHKAEQLEQEMLQREAAFKRWIDFQKIDANVVIKIFHSQLEHLAPHQFTGILPNPCYKVELILQPAPVPLPTLPLPFDLAAMLAVDQPPFMLAAVPCRYWGRSAIAIHLDGVLSQKTIAGLEDYIVNYTGIPVDEAIPEEQYELTSATRFAQLLITWRFLEQINYLLQKNR